MQTTYSSGLTGSFTESELLMMPRRYTRDGSKMGIVFCHFGGGTSLRPAIDEDNFPNYTAVMRSLVNIGGWPMVSSDLGFQSFGNATARSRIDSAISYLQSPTGGGAKVGKVCLIGTSMGGMAAMNYAAWKPSNVACIVGWIPVCDVADIRNNNRPGGWTGTSQNAPLNAAGVNNAYGLPLNSTSDYPLHGQSYAALPTPPDYCNPMDSGPIVAAAGIPCACWYSADDATCLPVYAEALYGTILKAEMHMTHGAHGDPAMAECDPLDVRDFILRWET